MNKFWLKKCKKSVTSARKGKTKERNKECFALSNFTCICFFNGQSCKCGQLSQNYTKRNLGNPNFSSTTIVIPL